MGIASLVALVAIFSLAGVHFHWPRNKLWHALPYGICLLAGIVGGVLDEGLAGSWSKILPLLLVLVPLHLIYWWDARDRLAGRPHMYSDPVQVNPEEVSARVSDAHPYLLRVLCQATLALTDEGSWALRDYELKLIRAAAAKLSPANRAALNEQVKASIYVERIHHGQMTRIHFQPRDGVRKMDVPDDYRLAKMTLKLKSKAAGVSVEAYNGLIVAFRKQARRSVTVSVEAVDGLIRSLTYYGLPKPVVLGDFDIATIEFGGMSDTALRRSIERKEFGRATS